MNKTSKTLIIALVIVIAVGIIVFSYLFVSGNLLKKETPVVTPIVKETKDQTELKVLKEDLKIADELDLTELDDISNDLNQIDLSGL